MGIIQPLNKKAKARLIEDKVTQISKSCYLLTHHYVFCHYGFVPPINR